MKKIVLLALMLAGCETTMQSASDRVFAEYKGKPVQQLMRFWGSPSRHTSNPVGTLYIWVDQPAARNCQMEVQGDQFEHIEGIRAVGGERACVGMFQMVKH